MISSKISGLFLSLIFILSLMAMMMFWVLSSAPCLELFSAAPESKRPRNLIFGLMLTREVKNPPLGTRQKIMIYFVSSSLNGTHSAFLWVESMLDIHYTKVCNKCRGLHIVSIPWKHGSIYGRICVHSDLKCVSTHAVDSPHWANLYTSRGTWRHTRYTLHPA